MKNRKIVVNRCAAACAALILVTIMIPAGVQAATTTPHSNSGLAANAPTPASLLKKGLAFYRGKTITLIAPDSPGGGPGNLGVALTPFLDSYLGATVNEEYISVGGQVGGQDTAAGARPDGLTLGLFSSAYDASDVLTSTPGLTFNLARLPILAEFGPSQAFAGVLSSSPIQNFQDLVKSPTTVGEVTAVGTPVIDLTLLNLAYGINARVVTGYSSAAQAFQGFIRGDGALGEGQLSLFCPLLTSGQVRPILISVAPAPGSACAAQLANVPDYHTLETKFAPKTPFRRAALVAAATLQNLRFGVFAPKGTPDYAVVALQAAMKAISVMPAFTQRELLFGQTPGYVSPAKAVTMYNLLLKDKKKFKSYLAAAG